MNQHHVFVILGSAESEEAKLYRRPQWQGCCELLVRASLRYFAGCPWGMMSTEHGACRSTCSDTLPIMNRSTRLIP